MGINLDVRLQILLLVQVHESSASLYVLQFVPKNEVGELGLAVHFFFSGTSDGKV